MYTFWAALLPRPAALVPFIEPLLREGLQSVVILHSWFLPFRKPFEQTYIDIYRRPINQRLLFLSGSLLPTTERPTIYSTNYQHRTSVRGTAARSPQQHCTTQRALPCKTRLWGGGRLRLVACPRCEMSEGENAKRMRNAECNEGSRVSGGFTMLRSSGMRGTCQGGS